MVTFLTVNQVNLCYPETDLGPSSVLCWGPDVGESITCERGDPTAPAYQKRGAAWCVGKTDRQWSVRIREELLVGGDTSLI